MSFLSDLGRFIVAQVGVEGGNQHERILKVTVNLFEVRLNSFGAMMVEGAAGVGEETDRVKKIVDNHRFEDVELEVSL